MKKGKHGYPIFREKGTAYSSYQNGWQKAVENFEKYAKEFKLTRIYHLHSN